ncbi:DUF2975 domain-containing protein [Desulfosporosinus fructosivorans]
MNQDQANIRTIKKRAGIIQKVVQFIFIIGVILLIATLIVAVVMFFASPDKFNAVQGSVDWSIHYTLINGSTFFIDIPYKIIQLSDSRFSAKYAAIASLLSITISISFIMYGIMQVSNIFKSTAHDITPFIMDNVKSLENIAYTVIIYSVTVNFLTNLLFFVFVTKMYISFSSFHLSGVLTGMFIFFMADIFKYGVFLQKEFDTTL